VIFINQIREKIGVMFGNPETTPGGRALKFYASVRIEVNRVTAIKAGEVVVGNRTRAKVVKNKVAPPFRRAEFDIIYGKGISFAGDVLDLAETAKLVGRSGSWYTYKGGQLAQGREKAVAVLEERKDLLEGLAQEVRRHHLPPLAGEAPGEKPEKTGTPEEPKPMKRTA
jgi:recombination protein RecA